ncbi:heavy-metal-associated domain-containing protein (plasmid) [Pedobacter sp. BS3]|uniref:heavy-metal-associated domain-containing protein n=1 Tax=Pedobacter sp. BS3 TaxID=2567937 RepID=UPI0011EDAAA7|nr:heavy-metal-associated domain-containing protein [Pedobacter sp. BS3]TZF85893.1 heavy-metal-associated domain-containing protein [Pedobacter sp. BS3]
MRTLKAIALIIFVAASLSAAAQTKTEVIKVNGECNLCKKKIENAVKASVITAKWDPKTKLMKVSYNPEKTSPMEIQQKIAAAGYDTEKVKASDAAYHALDECCQYDRNRLAE